MKIIFSRKGFDSSAGGYPSLVFPDGTLFSVPIPSSNDVLSYADLDFEYEGESIRDILSQVTGNQIRTGKKWKTCDYTDTSQRCHYDPMKITIDGKNRIALGQVSSSEGHLRNQGVSEGDMFLFYGWYKPLVRDKGKWQYDRSQNDIHQIWGYMIVGERLEIDTRIQEEMIVNRYPWLKSHPHIGGNNDKQNCIYLSDEGRYFDFAEKRCLTDIKEYKGRSTWRLPSCFNQPQAFSFLKNFAQDEQEVVITFRGFGQEFVLNLDKVTDHHDRDSILSYLEGIVDAPDHGIN